METNRVDSIQNLLQGVSSIPSLPAVALRIIQEVRKDKSSMVELAKIISFDPALTAKILRVANSSLYALPYKVESIERAVNVLGLEALKNIALSFAIVRGFKKDNMDAFDHEFFWKRSITSAVSAGMIAEKMGLRKEDSFVTPLLMDIGILVMYLCRPEAYIRVLDEKRIYQVSTVDAERSVFGFDHQEAGYEILKQWGIPENIYMPVAYHHSVSESPHDLRDASEVLRLADLSSSIYHGSSTAEKFKELRARLQERPGLDDEEIEGFVDSIAEKTVDILASFEISPGDMKPYSQILEEVNEELGRLNLSYEQLVMELKQEKQKVETLAGELKKANLQLRELSVRDELTGLYNRRFFNEFMDRELLRVERYNNNFSFIMIDIDHFKKFNDTYGHTFGDQVLSTIADVFQQTIRGTDTAARYGGEEFAIVLPETDLKGALVLAERMRQIVEGLELQFGDQLVKVTISLGVTTYDTSKGKKDKQTIIDAADKALYNSKETGRNKLSVIV